MKRAVKDSVFLLSLFKGDCLSCQFKREEWQFIFVVIHPLHNQPFDSTVNAHDSYSAALSASQSLCLHVLAKASVSKDSLAISLLVYSLPYNFQGILPFYRLEHEVMSSSFLFSIIILTF